MYKRSGKVQIVHEHYDAALMFVQFLDRNAVNKSSACPRCAETEPLYTMASTADWLCCDMLPHCGDESGSPGRCNMNCPKSSASAFAHVLATARLVDMATAIGRTADAQYYSSRLSLLKLAYHARFYDSEVGRYNEPGTASWIQSHQVFPLYLDITPPEQVPTTVAALVNSIHNQSFHLNCGIIGSRFILDVLTKHGHGDLALTLATNPSCPSWGYMVERRSGEPASHDTPGTTIMVLSYIFVLRTACPTRSATYS